MKRILKTSLLRKNIGYLLAGNAFLYSATGIASNFQNFIGINYANPAELAVLVKDLEIIASQNYQFPQIDFNGTITVPDPFLISNVVNSGEGSNTGSYDLFYGRIAKRVSKQAVVSLDVTQPFRTIIHYPGDSLIRYATTNTVLSTVDYSPNLAYKFPGKLAVLALGVGLDIMQVRAALDKKFPSLTIPFGAGPDINITNHGNAMAEGWHAGASYALDETTFFGLSYYSALIPNVKGRSTFTGFPTSYDLSARINLPPTSTASITKIFSEKWQAKLQAHFTEWSRLRKVVIRNVAGPAPNTLVLLNYKNTWEVDAAARYNVTDKFFLGGLLAYDQTPTNDRDRTLNLPEVDQVVVGLAAGYKLTKVLTAQIEYGHIFLVKQVPINSVDPNDGTATDGSADVAFDGIGLVLTATL